MAPQNTLALRSDTDVAKRHSFGAESMSTADSDDQEMAVANRRQAAQASQLGFKLNKGAQQEMVLDFLNELQHRNDAARYDYRGVRLKREFLTYQEWMELSEKARKPVMRCEVSFL